jgi:hypothetical protein
MADMLFFIPTVNESAMPVTQTSILPSSGVIVPIILIIILILALIYVWSRGKNEEW